MSYTILAGGYSKLGIHVLKFAPESGSLTLQEETIPAGENVAWIEENPHDPSIVFVTNECDDGRVIVIQLSGDAATTLKGVTLANVSSGGGSPAHLEVTKEALIPGNYMGGSLLVLPYKSSPFSVKEVPATPDGGAFVAFQGTGPNPNRQEQSHPHEVYAYGENELLVPDLGADKTWRVVKNPDTGAWENKAAIDYAPGSGPRHVLVHDGFLFTSLELSNEVSLHTFPPYPEQPKHIVTASTYVAGSAPSPLSLVSEILLSPSKKALYVSNRNDPSPDGDSIAVFSVPDTLTGFKLLKEVRTKANHARGMNLSKDGKYLGVVGQKSNSLSILKVVEGRDDADLELVTSIDGVAAPIAVAWL